MTTITVAIEDTIFERLRLTAVQRNTTVDSLVQEAIAQLAAPAREPDEARKRLLELIDSSEGRMAPGYKFNREELYDR